MVASYAGQPLLARNDWSLDGNKNGNNAVGIGFCRVPNGTPKIGWVVLLPATLWQATLV